MDYCTVFQMMIDDALFQSIRNNKRAINWKIAPLPLRLFQMNENNKGFFMCKINICRTQNSFHSFVEQNHDSILAKTLFYTHMWSLYNNENWHKKYVQKMIPLKSVRFTIILFHTVAQSFFICCILTTNNIKMNINFATNLICEYKKLTYITDEFISHNNFV